LDELLPVPKLAPVLPLEHPIAPGVQWGDEFVSVDESSSAQPAITFKTIARLRKR
jgi:hypothetical protein